MKTHVTIIGGGPGGAASALYLKQLGIDSVIIEKETFPRYHIGESMTGECGALVRGLGLEQKMLDANFPIKRGLTVFGKTGHNPWFVPVMGRDKEWNLFDQHTWQVRRSEFDKMLLDEAISQGVEVIKAQAITPLVDDDKSVCGVRIQHSDMDTRQEIKSDVLLDCSGQATFLANNGVTGPKFRGNYDRQIAIYSQVKGAIRDDGPHRDNTLIFYKTKYLWSWFIPLDNETVSVGIVAPAAYFKDKNESKQQFLLRELSELNPELARRTVDIELVEDIHSIVNYSYQVSQFCGKGFICVGDAHRFIDPIFSFGLFATMREAQLTAPVVKSWLEGKGRDLKNPFAEHEQNCDRALDIVEDTIDTFWEYPLAFAMFTHKRYKAEVIDILAGRVFDKQPSVAINAMRKLINRDRDNSQTSPLPQGSRFHPERANIWNDQIIEANNSTG